MAPMCWIAKLEIDTSKEINAREFHSICEVIISLFRRIFLLSLMLVLYPRNHVEDLSDAMIVANTISNKMRIDIIRK